MNASSLPSRRIEPAGDLWVAPVSEPVPGPGADLKAARESLQVSIREVADALNLPARVIEALETDDYDRLPPTVFTRGYLRSYARLLELPSDELLARYPEVTEELDVAADTRTGTHAVAKGSRQLLLPVSIGVIVVVVLLTWLLSDEGSEPADVQPAPGAPEAVIGPEPSPDQAEPVVQTAEPAVEPPAAATPEAPGHEPTPAGEPAVEPSGTGSVTGREAEATPETVPSVAVGDEAEVSLPSAAGTGTFRERRITEFGDDRVVLHFTEDCWVEVKSMDGENLYSDLNRAGATLELTGRAPFRVLLGYAPGVSLEFNGEQVALARYSRNNVASLVLGQ